MEGPTRIAEVALQLAHDGGHRVAGEGGAAAHVKPVYRFHESHAGDLHEVVDGLVPALVAAREPAHERHEALYQHLPGRGIAMVVVSRKELPILSPPCEPRARAVALVASQDGGHDTGTTAFRLWRSGSTRTTSHARPRRSSPRITQADRSISHQRSPCAADVGNAWWLLCHASPSENGASQARL